MIPGGQDISNYHVDGQIAQAVHGGKTEHFLWDDLALVHRGETSFVNEPYVTGGNPILSSKQGVMFNDMLGNTLGTKQEKYSSVSMTAFGETKDADALFTGKPYIGELGYASLFRNYRADKGKWLSADPLGYPDGWNNLAYGNNAVTTGFDWLGGEWITVINNPQPQDYNNNQQIYSSTAIDGVRQILQIYEVHYILDSIENFYYDDGKTWKQSWFYDADITTGKRVYVKKNEPTHLYVLDVDETVTNRISPAYVRLIIRKWIDE